MNTVVGTWLSDPSFNPDQPYEHVIIEFKNDGTATYKIIENEVENIILLVYRIEDGEIITDQPSHPGEARTQFNFTPDGKLVLGFEGKTYRYVRLG